MYLPPITRSAGAHSDTSIEVNVEIIIVHKSKMQIKGLPIYSPSVLELIGFEVPDVNILIQIN